MDKRSSFLISEIYETTVNPDHWEYVLQVLAKVTKSKAACLFFKDKEFDFASTLANFGCSKDMMDDYKNQSRNLGLLFGDNEKPLDKKIDQTCQQFYPSSKNSNDVHNKFFDEWIVPYGFHHLGIMQFLDDKIQSASIVIMRDKKAGAWSNADLRVINEVEPHLKRALNIHAEFTRLRIQFDALHKGLDRLVIGLILFDSSAHPVYVNPTAKTIIKGHPSLTLTEEGLYLNPEQKDIDLRQTILDVAMIDPEDSWKQTKAIGITHPDVKATLPVLVTPMHAHELTSDIKHEGAKVAVFISDPNQEQPISTESLMSVYDLSQSEAQVAIGIVNGLSIEEIASGTFRSVHTIRSQLKAVFGKIGVSRQNDLIKLLLTGPFAHRRRSSSESDTDYNKFYNE